MQRTWSISKPSDLFIHPTSLNCLPKLAHVYAKLPIPTSLPLPFFLLLVFITTQLPIHESIAVPSTLPRSLLNYYPSHSILFLFYEKTQWIKIFTLFFITLPFASCITATFSFPNWWWKLEHQSMLHSISFALLPALLYKACTYISGCCPFLLALSCSPFPSMEVWNKAHFGGTDLCTIPYHHFQQKSCSKFVQNSKLQKIYKRVRSISLVFSSFWLM